MKFHILKGGERMLDKALCQALRLEFAKAATKADSKAIC
jgi:hypothetical protein